MKFLPSHVVQHAIDSAGGKAFYIEFVKRTTGELRTMTARTGVHAYVKGVLPPGLRKEQDGAIACVTVFELSSGKYKRVPLDSVTRVHANNVQLTA